MKASEFHTRMSQIEDLLGERHTVATMICDLDGLGAEDEGQLQISITDSDDFVTVPASLTAQFKDKFAMVAKAALAETEAKLIALGVELDVPATVDATSSFSLRNYLAAKNGEDADDAEVAA